MPEHAAPVPFATAEMNGRLLAHRYRIGDPIASGGMAQVYRATDDVLGREVAIKILHPHLATDPALVDRFRHEAIAAARLTHSAIVAVYDTVAEDGVNAIVMELVNGITLRQFLDQQGPLSIPDAVDVVTGVAKALHIAHQAGIVHRDIKPANILMCDDRRVKVADFGIAKATADHDLTQAGTMLGTAKYLAPEQVRGERVDPRTDIYALGVVLYECLTGKVPFEADTDAATALARLHRDPLRVRMVRPSVPRSLDLVIMQALAREPADRPATAEAFRAALLSAEPDDATSPIDLDHTVAGPLLAAAAEPSSFVRSERRLLVPALLVALIGGSLALAGVLIGQTETGQQLFDRAREVVTSTGSPGADSPLPIRRAIAFDPIGADGENDEHAGLAIDGNPETVWPSEFYDARFWETKDGVGLVVELEGESPLTSVEVTSPTNAWSAEIYIAPAHREDLAEWGQPVLTPSQVPAGTVTFELGGRRGGAILIWFTQLGDAPPGALRIQIANVAVRGG